ncbi:MAG: tRNA (pseudouridine(54)-N(1))-methyltransferase TrmY [Candidatus Pacearchaeota archaeon]
MREFLFFSRTARTSGNFRDLMEAGRMDIACHVVINSFFISNKMRDDVKLHLVFYGPPTPPRHLEMFPGKIIPETGKQAGKQQLDISKKDVANVIRKMLFKYREGKKTEVWNGFEIEKKNLTEVVEQLKKEGKTIYLLDPNGEEIEKVKIEKNSVFILGDHKGIPVKELKRLKEMCVPVSLGKVVYFASQAVTIVNYELDKRGI